MSCNPEKIVTSPKNQTIYEQEIQSFHLANTYSTPIPNQKEYNNSDLVSNDSNISKNSTSTSTRDFTEQSSVTHSFANRKRSVTRKRKSVLSSSFIINDIDGSISIALNTTQEQINNMNEMKEDIAKEINNQIPSESGSINPIQHNLDSTTCKGDLYPSTTEKSGEIFESEQDPINDPFETDNTIHEILPNDVSQIQDVVIDTLQATETQIIDAPMSTPILNDESFNSSTPTQSSSNTPKSKEKISSWSPRKFFQSSSNKSSDHDANTKKLAKKSSISSMHGFFTKETDNNTNKKQEKFNIASLFNRKGSKTNLLEEPVEVEQQVQINYARLPIQTERIIYRLSHLKLSNPKRSLRDQVVISNLMFWYLSIAHQPVQSNVTGDEHQKDMAIFQFNKKSKQQQKRNLSKRKTGTNHQQKSSRKKSHQAIYARISNSSSDEEEDDDTSIDSISSYEYDSSVNSLSKKKKYSLFRKSPATTSWLSFSKPQSSITIRDNEDDIPLAMYQRNKN